MKINRLSLLILLVFCLSAVSLQASVTNKEYLSTVIPGTCKPSFVLPALGGGAILSIAINPLEKRFKDNLYAHSFLPEVVSHTCDRYIADFWFVPVSIAGAMAEGLKNDRYYEPLRHMAVSHAMNLGLTYALKWSIGRIRPDGTPLSFPSGHTSISFTTATLMYNWHGPLAGIPMYSLAVLTALSRINDQRHWPADVLFGAILGTVTARALYVSERNEKDNTASVMTLPVVEFRFSSARWSRK